MTPPDHFSLGPLTIYYYSLCLLTAVWAGYWLAVRRVKDSGLTVNQLNDVILVALVAGVIGARLGFVLQNWSYFSHHTDAIFRLTTGGLSIHGAVIIGTLALYLYARRQSVRFLTLTDTLALPLLLGQIIGRLGNYFNQELFGYPTNIPWKLFINQAHRPTQYAQFSYFHPTFLYEMFLNTVGLIVLSRLKLKKPGQLTGAYLIVFSVSRFITEIWRISERIIFGLSLAQLLSLVGLVVGLILLQKKSQVGRDD